MFPHIPKENYSDSGEPIHGGSIAINRFLTTLTQMAEKDQRPSFKLVIINLMTLVRNCYNPDPTQVLKGIASELSILGTYIDAYLLKQGVPQGYTLPIIVYVPTYRALPVALQREAGAEMRRVQTVMPRVVKMVSELTKSLPPGQHTSIQFFTVGTEKLYPHKELGTELARLGKDQLFNYNYGDPYLMLSHIPLDWHVVAKLPNLSLIESYTGKLIATNQLGDKLIGTPGKNVPFSSDLHRVFGDSVIVKAIVVRKQKKLMLEAASKWAMLTRARILDQMSQIAGVPATSIRIPSFD